MSRSFTVAAAISLLLCIISLEWWRESYGMHPTVRRTASVNRFYVFRSELGILELDRTDCYSGHLPPQFDKQFNIYLLPQGLSISWNSRCKSVFGFGYRNEPLILPMANNLVIATTRSWSVPMWSLAVATSVLPAIYILKARKARRRRLSNACLRCGYWLTGNTSGVCPECGELVPQLASSSGDNGIFAAIPAQLRFLVLAHVLASWAVSLAYTLLEIFLGRGHFSFVQWFLEFVFAPIRVPMYLVLGPFEIIQMARHHSIPLPAYLLRVALSLFPFALVYVLTFVLTFRRLKARQVLQTSIASESCCRKCHYDLRGSPDRCPECGTLVPKTENSAAPAGKNARPA